MTTIEPTFFETADQFRGWLARHHATAAELWVGFHRKGSGRPSITWPESVDQALCFGWIDGVRRSLDGGSYMIRFTPRRTTSIWSAVNIRRANALIAAGLMEPAGLRAFEARDDRRTARYSFEREQVALEPEQERRFRRHRKAWAFFQAQPPGYRRTATWWVVSAKREATREKRLATLIEDSAAGRRIALLRREK
jgi:uncharacterized protein YdeI (YjbR/CyaY-like superfamily)